MIIEVHIRSSKAYKVLLKSILRGCLLQRGVPVVAVPDLGHPSPGGGEGLPGPQRHRLGAGPPGGEAAAGEDLPPQDTI